MYQNFGTPAFIFYSLHQRSRTPLLVLKDAHRPARCQIGASIPRLPCQRDLHRLGGVRDTEKLEIHHKVSSRLLIIRPTWKRSSFRSNRCHRSVVAASSKFLEKLLKDVEPEDDVTSIIFTDITNDELEQLISFLYSGSVTFASCTESQRFKSLIHQLGIHVPSLSPTSPPAATVASSASTLCEDLCALMVDDFGQSTVDHTEILFEFQASSQDVEEVDQILAEIMSDYGKMK